MNMDKVVYIMRGPPGSGKSFYCMKKLQMSKKGMNKHNWKSLLKTHVLSTDDYFIVNGKYVFDPEKLPEYHAKNMARTEQLMMGTKHEKPLSPLFIDNTNIDIHHIMPYYDLAIKHNYTPVITNMRDYHVEKYNEIWIDGKDGKKMINRKLLLDRAQKRRDSGSGKDIPDDVIHKMCDQYERIRNGVVCVVDIVDAKDTERVLQGLGAAPGEWGTMDKRKNVLTASGRRVPTQRLVAQYIAVFLDQASRRFLKENFPAPSRSANWHGSHITLAFRPSAYQRRTLPIGKTVRVELKAYAHDEYVQAVAVSLPDTGVHSQNKIPHVTLSVSKTSPYGPVYSNILLERLGVRTKAWKGKLPKYIGSDGKVYPPTNAVYIPINKAPGQFVSGIVCDNALFNPNGDVCGASPGDGGKDSGRKRRTRHR